MPLNHWWIILLSVSLMIQTLEWLVISNEVPKYSSINRILLRALLVVRLLSAFGLIASLGGHGTGDRPEIIIFCTLGLWASTLPILFSFRGVFNGGSDYMTVVHLIGLSLVSLGFESAGLFYIAIQTLLSYFIAGWVKLLSSDWRSGTALPRFFRNPSLGVPKSLGSILENVRVSKPMGYGIIAWETLSPLALLSPQGMVVFCVSAAIFHLFNAWALGLNRFFWAWLASYPTLLWLSRWLSERF